MTAFDTVRTSDTSVICDGDGGAMSHPRVYLHMEDGRIVCPYCSRTFLLAHDHDEMPERAIAQEAPGIPATALDLEKSH